MPNNHLQALFSYMADNKVHTKTVTFKNSPLVLEQIETMLNDARQFDGLLRVEQSKRFPLVVKFTLTNKAIEQIQF